MAFGNRNDFHHAWAVEIAGRITEPLLTCEAVLAETAFHLGGGALVLAFLRDGMVRGAFSLSEHAGRIAELAARYADRQPGLADLCPIRMSELCPRYPVITTDLAGFRVYRRGRRQVIPPMHPPERRPRLPGRESASSPGEEAERGEERLGSQRIGGRAEVRRCV